MEQKTKISKSTALANFKCAVSDALYEADGLNVFEKCEALESIMQDARTNALNKEETNNA